MLYRKLDIAQGHAVIDQCEALGIDYDVWNSACIALGVAKKMEVGMAESDWKKISFDKPTNVS